MKSALRGLLCGAVLLATSIFGSASVNAQTATITINGCASLTSSGGTGNITINCAPTKSDGTLSCTSLSVTPATNANNPASIMLTANCTPGTNPITSYKFSGPGISFPTPQQGNTFTVSPAPTAPATYTVIASDGSSTSTVSGSYTVAGVPAGTGSVDLSACTALGYTGRLMNLTYAPSVNLELFSSTLGSFGNSNALVLRFTTPAVAGDTFGIQFTVVSMAPQVFRMATLATQPCQIATSAGASGSILTSVGPSKSPVFYFAVGGPKLGKFTLAPGTTYYITLVNRNGYNDTQGSCTASSCDVKMDFTN